MLNRVQYGHDPQENRFAVAIGSQSIGIWELAPGVESTVDSGVNTGSKPPATAPSLTVSTPRPAMRGVAFAAPSVLLSIHDSGDVAGWRIADEHGELLEKAELLWEVQLGQKPCMIETYAGYANPKFRIALGTKSGEVLLLIPQQDAQPEVVRGAAAHRNDVTALRFSPDGTRLASAGRDRVIRVWNTHDFDAPQDESSRMMRMSQQLNGCEAWPLCLAFSHAGDRLVSGGMDHDIYLWKIGASIDEPLLASAFEHHGWVVDVAWSRDDKVVASASWDNSVGIFEVDGLAQRALLRGHKDYVSSVHFSADSNALISGSYDGRMNRWNWRDATLETSQKAHSDWLLSLHIVDAGCVISVAGDRTAAVWHLPDLGCVGRLEGRPLGGFYADEALGLNGYSEPRLEPDVGFDTPDGSDSVVEESVLQESVLQESVLQESVLQESLVQKDVPQAAESVAETAVEKPSEPQELEPIFDSDAAKPGQVIAGQGKQVDSPAASTTPDSRADLGQALADAQRDGGEQSKALSDFFDQVPADLGLEKVSSTGELGEVVDGGEDAEGGREVGEDASMAAPNTREQTSGAQNIASEATDDPPLDSSNTVKLQSIEVDKTAAKDRAHADQKNAIKQASTRPVQSLKSRLKARVSESRPRGASVKKAPADESTSASPIYVGSIGSQDGKGSETENTPPDEAALADVGLEFQSDVFDAFGAALQEVDAVSTSQTPENSVAAGKKVPPTKCEPAGDPTDQPALEMALESDDHGADEIEADEIEVDEIEVDENFGNTTRFGMPSEAGLSANAITSPKMAEPNHVAHSLDERSGTLTSVQPIGRADADSAPPRDTGGLDEVTAPRMSSLAQEFETPTRVELRRGEKNEDPTTQISNSDLSMLRSGNRFSGKSQRLSAGRRGGNDLEVLDLQDKPKTRASEGVEVVETDFKELWERRWTPSAPGMAILRGGVSVTATYERVSAFVSPHGTLNSVSLDTKRKVIASGGDDGQVVIWALNGAEKHRFGVLDKQLNDVAFAAGATLVFAGDSDGVLHGWVLPQKTLGSSGVLRHAQQEAHASRILSLALSADEREMLSGSVGADARLWNMHNGVLSRALRGHKAAVSAVGFCKDSVVTASHDGVVRMWDSTGGHVDLEDCGVKILAMATHSGGVIWGGAAGRVRGRDDKDGEVRDFVAHDGKVAALSMTRRGAAASAGKDGLIHVYAPGATAPFQTLELGAPIATLERAGDYLVAGQDDGKIVVFKRG